MKRSGNGHSAKTAQIPDAALGTGTDARTLATS